MTPENTRKTQRVSPPNVMVRVSTAERFRAFYLKDLSEGGLFIKTERALAIGQKVLVDLLPPGFTVPIRLPAAVVRHAGVGPNQTAGMGVKFDSLPPETALALAALISSYMMDGATEEGLEPPPQSEVKLQYSNLKMAYELREKELATERDQRREAGRQIAALTAELEVLKAGSQSAGAGSKTEELKAQLAAVQNELVSTNIRLEEALGNLAASAEEIDVLETDDAASRKLASTLAHEKLTLGKELDRLAGELKTERANAQSRVKELEGKRAEFDASEKEIIKSMHAELEARQLTAAAQTSRADGLQQQLTAQSVRLEAVEAHLKTLQSENAALAQKATSAEKAAKEGAVRLDRMKAKERELRQLLAAVSDGSEDEVVMIDSSGEEDIAIEETQSERVPSSLGDIFADAPAPRAADWKVPSGKVPDDSVTEHIELEFISEPVSLSRSDFDKRVQADEEFLPTGLFDAHQSKDDLEMKVKKLIESGPRFSQLTALVVQGVATGPQVLDALFKLHTAGAVKFR